jgi:branched-chain amino acid transport system ATP-binding protein
LKRVQTDNLLLDVRGLRKHFGGIMAVEDVTFAITNGSIISLIGPNGAGKSTFINLVSGVYRPDAGEIYFEGENVAGLPAYMMASKRLSRTFQLEELFNSLSVLENVMVGCHTCGSSGILSCGFSIPNARKEESRLHDRAMECLEEVGLEGRAHKAISQIPLGERKLVGIARALAMNPKLLMLDEPAGGLAAHEVERLSRLIKDLQSQGLTLLIVEHNMTFVMALSDHIVVLSGGEKIAEGSPVEVRNNDMVIKAYLGEEVD